MYMIKILIHIYKNSEVFQKKQAKQGRDWSMWNENVLLLVCVRHEIPDSQVTRKHQK